MTGPYYFAWVDANETTFDGSHIREDESVYSFRIDHQEGDFPSLEIDIRNPRVGLLSPGRNVWAWLSIDKNFGGEGGTDIVPLFHGRLVGLPEDLQNEMVTLSFTARPANYEDQKFILAQQLKVRPYWDPIWFSPDNLEDPDNVLESRPELWHIDRVTNELTSSHILEGEDGTIHVGEDDVIYESVHMTYGQAPLTQINVTASVSWDQIAAGIGVDLSRSMAFGGGNSILTYTGQGLVDNWPQPGASLGGGWTVIDGSCVRTDGVGKNVWGYGLRNVYGAAGGASADPFGRSYYASEDWHDLIVPEWAVASSFVGGNGGGGFEVNWPAHIFAVPRGRFTPTLNIALNSTRQRQEQLVFTLRADVQAIVTDPGDDNIENLSFSSSEVMTDLDPSDESGGMQMPIRTLHARAYFSTDRGEQSIEYLIALARSHLLARGRCVNIEFEIPFTDAVNMNLSCRKNVLVSDDRIPGASASGKIIHYELSCDGDTGAQICTITIGCSVGRGTSYEAQPGTPSYAEAGYMQPGYQRMEGQLIEAITGEVVYLSINGLPPNDDGVDLDRLTPAKIIVSLVKTGSYTDQETAMGDKADEPNTVFDRLKNVPTTFELDLLDLSKGSFLTNYALAVSGLAVPKTIDLEAEAVS